MSDAPNSHNNQNNHHHKPDIRQANDCPPLPADASMGDKIIYWLALGLGSGLPRRAPGTWGTVGGLIIGVPLMSLGFVPFAIITIIACLIGNKICGHASNLMGVHDDPHIVWDEWAGMWITLLPLSYIGLSVESLFQSYERGFNIAVFILAFILFRFFDIIKPPPIGWADKKVAGGLGIMLDDIIAGIMAAAVWLVIVYGAVYFFALD